MEWNDYALDSVMQEVKRRLIKLPDGAEIPVIGQGTWHMGNDPFHRASEQEALRLGVRLGLSLIDTAEMYGEGRSESLIGESITDNRDHIFLVSKAYPNHATRKKLAIACDHSLKRLGTDHLDLYLLHWRGATPLEETVRGMEELKQAGKILRWGVSNFDTKDMEDLWAVPDGKHCVVNQVLYHLGSRGIEFELLPWMREHHVAVMAYCPLAEGGSLKSQLLKDPAVIKAAADHQATPLQILLAWAIRNAESDGIVAIPKAGRSEHVLLNAQAAAIRLSEEERRSFDLAFPRPSRKLPLDIV
ncbi:aldo/keto reductase [Sporolactobacillus shoreicorticis]|uniref:Aldo/keto reductase n=1 Tax=Sporolactobacillus shoreicorticis TaxID=1923877 RepID=A0ABW5S9F2_9BACL|nr:aldo/keto reductase [Sporolactobacillus shoreicorticis]MCO7126923.1 aldo/keto reductase [Sporolactobacillus shoreicorticis]